MGDHHLVVIETHPIQYHAPVYRALEQHFGIPVSVIYGSDFSVAGYHDPEFDATFAWDTDLLSGYTSCFLSRVAQGGAPSAEEVSARGISGHLARLSPAAILLVGYSPRFYQHAAWQAWRSGYPLLFRGETTDHARERNLLKRQIRDNALRWFYGRCAKLLYVGRHSYAHYRRLNCSEQKLGVSPYCVDTTPFEMDEAARERLRGATREALGLPEGRIVLLSSGKLVSRKGPDLLLKAVKRLAPDLRERTTVLFLGDGSERQSLQSLADAAPAVTIHVAGFKNQRELSPYYHAADALILPSRHSETWGLVVNEALHHGLPCVVSDLVGCAPDLIRSGETGEVFPADSDQALALAIQSVVNLMNRSEIRTECRRQVSGYTVMKAAEGIAGAYGEVVERTHTGTPDRDVT